MKSPQIKILSKGELKSKLSFLVLHHNPEIVIQESEWKDVYNFYLGYVTCFKAVLSYPFDDSYAHNFILEECFNFLISTHL